MSPDNMPGGASQGSEPERRGIGDSGATFKWLEDTLQELVQTTTEVVRRGREAKAELDEVARDLDQMRAQRQSLLSEVESLERRRRDLEDEIELERRSAVSQIEQVRATAESEVTRLRQSKERLEGEIRGLEERRAELARQIESFLRDQLTVLRRMDAESKAVAAMFRSAAEHPHEGAQSGIEAPAPRQVTEQSSNHLVERRAEEAPLRAAMAQVSVVAKGFPDMATLIAFQKAVEQLSSVSRIDTREFRDGRLYLRVSVRDRARLEAEIGQLPGIPVSAVTASAESIFVDLPS